MLPSKMRIVYLRQKYSTHYSVLFLCVIPCL